MENNPISEHYQNFERRPIETVTVISEQITTLKNDFRTVDDPEEKVIDLKWFKICWIKHHYSEEPTQYGHIILTVDRPVRRGTVWTDNNQNKFISRGENTLINVTRELHNYKKPTLLIFLCSTYIREESTR